MIKNNGLRIILFANVAITVTTACLLAVAWTKLSILHSDAIRWESHFETSASGEKVSIPQVKNEPKLSQSSNDLISFVLTDDTFVELPQGIFDITSDLTIPICLRFTNQTRLKPAKNVTVVLAGGYQASDYAHLFDLSAGGRISIQQRAYVTPNHWGVASSAKDNAKAFNDAIESALHDDIPLVVPTGKYTCLSTIKNSSRGKLKIIGLGSTELFFPNDTGGLHLAYVERAHISNLSIRGNGQNKHGVFVSHGATNFSLTECSLSGFGTSENIGQVFCLDVDGVSIQNNSFSDSFGLARDILMLNCSDIICTQNQCNSSNSEGITVSSTVVGKRMHGVIGNNLCKNHSRHGILVGYGGDRVELTVVGNRCHNCSVTGIYDQGGTAPADYLIHGKLAIVGNTISNCGGGNSTDQAGNAGIHLSGHAGTTCIGNLITDSGYDENGVERSAFGRGIYLTAAANCTISGNTVMNSKRAGIEFFPSLPLHSIVVTGNLIQDADYLLFLVNSGGQTKTNILVCDNILSQKTRDGWGIYLHESAGGMEIVFRQNTIQGLRRASNKSAFESWTERYRNITFMGNRLIDWDRGLSSTNDNGTENDWSVGLQLRIDENEFLRVTKPFDFRPVYQAVGKSNQFVSSNPGYSTSCVPASFANGVLDGYFVDELPSRSCRVGDKLFPLLPATNLSGYVNLASPPQPKKISGVDPIADTLTIKSHKLSRKERFRVIGNLPSPLIPGGEYYVAEVIDAHKIKLAEYRTDSDFVDLQSEGGVGEIQQLDFGPVWKELTTNRNSIK